MGQAHKPVRRARLVPHGIVCTGETYAKVVKLTFAKGAGIPDPSGLFNASLEGNTRRAIDIREGEQVDPDAFKALVQAAVAHNGSSPPAKPKTAPAPTTSTHHLSQGWLHLCAGAHARWKNARLLGVFPQEWHRRAVPGSFDREQQIGTWTTYDAGGKPAKVTEMKPGAKTRPAASPKERPKLQPNEQGVVLLSGGNPQIAKADGDAPVQAYIAAMPAGSASASGSTSSSCAPVPRVQKAVRWNSPFYGIEGQGSFLGLHCLTKYVKLAFFRGASLRPLPPGTSKQKDVRYLDIYEDVPLDEDLLASWIRQASELPGEKLF